MSTEKYSTIIKFSQAAEQSDGAVKRIIGFVQAKHMIGLFDDATLDANPRSAKSNNVVDDIMYSLKEDPLIYQFKTKGILLGTSDYRALERKRFQLYFNDPACEGLLDGGHNMLAIGKHMLSEVLDEASIKRIKFWPDFKEKWLEHRDEVKAVRDNFDFKVPVELIVPSDTNDDNIVSKFRMHILDICAARNNNAQLTTETRANQKGFYDEIRKRLTKDIAERVEWKANVWDSDEKRPVKVRDLVALSWIPLLRLHDEGMLPTETEAGSKLNFGLSPQKIYASKGECSKLFDTLMEHPDVTNTHDSPQHEMHNVSIGSAFDILADLPELYDWIYLHLGEAYNRAGGSFGRIKVVKAPARAGHFSHYTRQDAKYRYPEGFIMPLVYGLKALMIVKDDLVTWGVDPRKFLERNFDSIVKAFRMPLEMANWDPQKLGKNENSYNFVESEFEKALLRERA